MHTVILRFVKYVNSQVRREWYDFVPLLFFSFFLNKKCSYSFISVDVLGLINITRHIVHHDTYQVLQKFF